MIKVGIGRWTYEAWRGLFIPDKLPNQGVISRQQARNVH